MLLIYFYMSISVVPKGSANSEFWGLRGSMVPKRFRNTDK
jgi:hypothetical protein